MISLGSQIKGGGQALLSSKAGGGMELADLAFSLSCLRRMTARIQRLGGSMCIEGLELKIGFLCYLRTGESQIKD